MIRILSGGFWTVSQPAVAFCDRLDAQHIASLIQLKEMVGAESDVFTIAPPTDCDNEVFDIDSAVASLPCTCQSIDIVAIHVVSWQLVDLT